MEIQVLKDVFFFLGSVLGIIAFMKTILEPMLESNRSRWMETKERIREEDFINLEFEIEARRINDETLSAVRNFINDIEEGAEYLRFNSILRGRYHETLRNLRTLYWQLRELVQVPYWEPEGLSNDDGDELRFLRLNKEYFFTHFTDRNAYVNHLEAAAEIAELMRIEFRKLSILSNLHIIQIPLAKRIVSKDSKIPKRAPLPSNTSGK